VKALVGLDTQVRPVGPETAGHGLGREKLGVTLSLAALWG
jgi:hypothetical protein